MIHTTIMHLQNTEEETPKSVQGDHRESEIYRNFQIQRCLKVRERKWKRTGKKSSRSMGRRWQGEE